MPEKAKEEAKEKLVWLARTGYCTRGVVYMLVGVLAVLAALGEGGKTTDSKGALLTVMSSPFGGVMIAIIIVGLFGYALWRLVQAIKDTDAHGKDVKGLAIRAGLLVSALTHILLGIFAAGLLFGFGTGGGDGGKAGLVAKVLQQPLGRWLIYLVALCIFGAALAHIFKAYKEKYKKRFSMDSQLMDKLNPLIKFGLVARAVVLTIMAFFLAYAAWSYDPEKTIGLEAALDFIRGQAYGAFLLGLVALGLFAFGIYSVLEGIYRRIHPE